MKSCPCGETPEEIHLYGWTPLSKWTIASPGCCSEWMFEFRSNYLKEMEPVQALAVIAWNELPRK